EQLQQIVTFELGLFTAQTRDVQAGLLSAQGGRGGPRFLVDQEFYLGINDPLGLNPTGRSFEPRVFTLFDAWKNLSTIGPVLPIRAPAPNASDQGLVESPIERSLRRAARESVARGQELFNTKVIPITDVAGLNDVLGDSVIPGTCSTCHDTPNSGNHSISA